jgi:lipoprotein-anchoring transpeptidase ErfK/SrfK
MKLKSLFAAAALAAALFTQHAHASSQAVSADEANFMDEFDPRMEGAEQVLDFYDNYQLEETGVSADARFDPQNLLNNVGSGCYRTSCKVFAHVKKSEQKLYLYIDGQLQAVWKTSTGVQGHGTPNFDTRPDGRIYNRYTSTKYPGGDYNGLGNMPYAVFIRGGFAIHGTGRGNWAKLGRPASHGCIRIHPDNAAVFNSFVRAAGVKNTWITVN